MKWNATFRHLRSEMDQPGGCIFSIVIFGLVFLAVMSANLHEVQIWRKQDEIALRGVEVDAEIVARYEAGALRGSELAKARHSQMASWDPLELELRYVFDGREIVSRGRVSIETYYRTRSSKTLKVKVSPDQPELWTALA